MAGEFRVINHSKQCFVYCRHPILNQVLSVQVFHVASCLRSGQVRMWRCFLYALWLPDALPQGGGNSSRAGLTVLNYCELKRDPL